MSWQRFALLCVQAVCVGGMVVAPFGQAWGVGLAFLAVYLVVRYLERRAPMSPRSSDDTEAPAR